MARKNKHVEVAVEPPAPSHPIAHAVSTALVIFCILYVAVFFAAKTDGFKATAEDRLEKLVGVPVQIGKSRATFRLNLVFENVASENGGRLGKPGFRIGKLTIAWSALDWAKTGGRFLKSVDFNDASLFFAPNEEGQWEPAFASGIGSWLANWAGFSVRKPPATAAVPAARESESETTAAPPKPHAATNDWGGLRFAVTNGRLVWWDSEGNEEAAIEKIDLTVTPLTLPNRAMTHLYVAFSEGRLGKQRRLQNFALEMLRTGSNSIILGCNGGWTSGKSKDVAERPAARSADTNAVAVVGGNAEVVADRVRKELTAGDGD